MRRNRHGDVGVTQSPKSWYQALHGNAVLDWTCASLTGTAKLNTAGAGCVKRALD
jgi:hypothetical protein